MVSTQVKFYSSLIFFIVCLIAAVIFIDNTNIARHHARFEQQVQNKLNEISHRLSFNHYSNIHIVKSLPALFAVHPNLSQQDFTIAAKHLFDGNN